MKDIIIFDTEFTAWEGSHARNWTGPGEYREIVQIGAIRIDPQTLQEKAPPFEILVRPQINKVLSAYFTRLTGITNEAVQKHGVLFALAAELFHGYARGAKLHCYGRDIDVLNENIALYGLENKTMPFSGRSIAPWFKKNGGDLPARAKVKKLELCSGNMARIVGAEFNAAAHSGLTDARSLRTAIEHLVTKEKRPSPFPGA